MLKNKRVKMLWVVDVMEEYGGKLANKYGAKFTKNLSEALEDTNVDAVWIAASTPFHMKAIKESAAKGKHIYVEKPLSLSTDDINEAYRVAKQYNVVLLVAWNRRSDPHYGKVKKVMEDKESGIGDPSLILIHNGDHPLPPVKIMIESGSIYHDFMAHDVDFSVYISGKAPTSVYATGTIFNEEMEKSLTEKNRWDGVFDTGVIIITFPDGTASLLTARRLSIQGYDQRIEILTKNGILVQNDNIPLTTVAKSGVDGGYLTDKIHHSFPDRYDESYANEVDHLARVLIDGEEPISRYIENYYVSRITDMALKSHQEKRVIEFEN